MLTHDEKIQKWLIRASILARFGSIGWVLGGAMFITFGWLGNTDRQRQFNAEMNNRPTIADPIINNVPSLAAGRALSTPLMDLMPIVMLGLGILSVGYGIYTFIIGMSEKDKEVSVEGYWAAELTKAISTDNISAFMSLINEGAKLNGKNSDGWPPLYLAAQKGDSSWAKALISAGANVDAKTTNGFTALISAAYDGHEGIVTELIAAGADVNAKTYKGTTALINASARNHKRIVDALKAAGAT
jgi:ankyrin repeat protein